MEVNKPQKGLFKGLGPLERQIHNNKKNFPKIRNFHQFSYEHGHKPNYVSTFQKFFAKRSYSKNQYPEKVKKYPNQSHFTLGISDGDRIKNHASVSEKDRTYISLNQIQYKKPQKLDPPKLIKRQQQGLGFADRPNVSYHPKQTGKRLFNKSVIASSNEAFNSFQQAFKSKQSQTLYNTTNMEHFKDASKITMQNPMYSFSRRQRFNPITGEKIGSCTSYGFEDYNEGKNQSYKANNFTRVERGNYQKQDIISGRIINY